MSETKTVEPEVVQPDPKAAAREAALARVENAEITISDEGALAPKNLDERYKIALWAHKSGLLPEAIKTPQQAWLVMERGAELGFPGLTSFEFIYVVKGQVRLKPAGAKAKAMASGLLEDAREELFGTGDAMYAKVTLKRRGLPTPIIGEFSMLDAKRAGLIRPGSGWENYPKRMLLARARGFAYADGFADIIGGLQVRETYDLDPGERINDEQGIGRRAEMPPIPPSVPDPLLAELAGTPPDGLHETHLEANREERERLRQTASVEQAAVPEGVETATKVEFPIADERAVPPPEVVQASLPLGAPNNALCPHKVTTRIVDKKTRTAHRECHDCGEVFPA